MGEGSGRVSCTAHLSAETVRRGRGECVGDAGDGGPRAPGKPTKGRRHIVEVLGRAHLGLDVLLREEENL